MANETYEQMKQRHEKEFAKIIDECPHTEIVVEDSNFDKTYKRLDSKRDITLRCRRCRLNVAGYIIDQSHSYMAYVNDAVSKYPGNPNTPERREK